MYVRGWKSLSPCENNTNNDGPEKNVPHVVVVETTLLTYGRRRNGITALMAFVYYDIGIGFGLESINGNGYLDNLRGFHTMIRYECRSKTFQYF